MYVYDGDAPGSSGYLYFDGDTGADAPLSNAEMRQMFNWINELALLHGLVSGSPLAVAAGQRTAGPVVQSISEAAGTTTVSRVA